MNLEIIDYTRFADSICVEYFDSNDSYQFKDIPIYGDFEHFVIDNGWLMSSEYYQEINDTKDLEQSFDDWLRHSMNQNHLQQFLTKHKT